MDNELQLAIAFGLMLFPLVLVEFAAFEYFGWLDVEVKNDLEAVRRRE